jgi:hypothetical protein
VAAATVRSNLSSANFKLATKRTVHPRATAPLNLVDTKLFP